MALRGLPLLRELVLPEVATGLHRLQREVLPQQHVLVLLREGEAGDVEHGIDALELLMFPRVHNVRGADVVVQILDQLGLEPEDAVVEE